MVRHASYSSPSSTEETQSVSPRTPDSYDTTAALHMVIAALNTILAAQNMPKAVITPFGGDQKTGPCLMPVGAVLCITHRYQSFRRSCI